MADKEQEEKGNNLRKDKVETLEEQCKRLGIGLAPPDHEVYQMGYSLSFVPRGRQNSRTTEPGPKPATESTTPGQETGPLSPQKLSEEKIRYNAMLGVLMWEQDPNPNTIRVVLKQAHDDGLDWRELYQLALRARQRATWLLNPAPSLEDVSPETL